MIQGMTAVSNDFNILEYVKKNPDWWKAKQYEPPLEPTWLQQYQDSKDDSIQELSSRILRRHHPVFETQPPITIRQVRHIEAPNNRPTFGMVNQRQNMASEVVVKAIRPYARKSHTSSYWEDSGWQRRGNNLIGHYKAGGNLYRGSIELTDSSYEPMKFYIYAPPRAILNGPHGVCYRRQGLSELRKYWIHFSEEPVDIDSGIIQIERNLSEALKMY